jgi:ribosomal protein S18 acetylase RimI-like enzyme
MPGYAVRRFADPSRVEELLALVHGAFGDLAIDPPSSALKETAADFATRLKSETCFVIEAETLIGSVFCVPQGDALYVGRLAVAPAFRRRGVASALIEATKTEARRCGATRITLKARIALASNVALFRRHGFVIVAEETHQGFAAPTSYAMEFRLAAARSRKTA